MKRGDVFFYLVVKPTWSLSYWWNNEVILHIPQKKKVLRVYNRINTWMFSIHVKAHRHWRRLSGF